MTDDNAARLKQARGLVLGLYGLSRALRLRGVTEAGLYQLPPSELEVLRYVMDTPGTPLSTMARELGLQTSNASVVVRNLVARELVEREPDPDDRRSVRLLPTMNAQHGMARIESSWTELLAVALENLSPDERDKLAAAGPALISLGKALKNPLPPEAPR